MRPLARQAKRAGSLRPLPARLRQRTSKRPRHLCRAAARKEEQTRNNAAARLVPRQTLTGGHYVPMLSRVTHRGQSLEIVVPGAAATARALAASTLLAVSLKRMRS